MSSRFLLVAVMGLGCASPLVSSVEPTPAPAAASAAAPSAAPVAAHADPVRAIVDAPDRDPGDRELDLRRKPVELLAFLAIQPGMRVADIGAGTGYTTELLARAVGPAGKVWGQNSKFVREKFAEKGWTERLAKPINANVVRVDREFVDPLPPEARDLDLVVNVLFYHDFEWLEVDRAAHNRAVFAALEPGGRYVIVDAHAKPGAGASESKTLHRIEESLVVAELEAAGFELSRRGDFLRNPDDTRDWNALPWVSATGVFSDKFVLELRKPLK
jgi:predicted methyltransferase